jgi:hypothetical protein
MKKNIIVTVLLIYISWFHLATSSKTPNPQHPPWLPKILWVIDENQQHPPIPLYKAFEQNHKMMQNGWEIRHISDTNAGEWLKQIPQLKDKLSEGQLMKLEPMVRT